MKAIPSLTDFLVLVSNQVIDQSRNMLIIVNGFKKKQNQVYTFSKFMVLKPRMLVIRLSRFFNMYHYLYIMTILDDNAYQQSKLYIYLYKVGLSL
jgi:hypothetical protein